MDDQHLLKAAQAGDEKAAAKLLEPHRSFIKNYLMKRVRSAEDCEDLVQEVFIRAVLYLNSFRGECRIEHWLLRIAVNLLKNYYRSLQSSSRIVSLEDEFEDFEEMLHGNDDPECLYSTVEEKVLIEQWLEMARKACHEMEFRVIWMYYRCESMEEVAQVLQIPAASAWSYFRRGRAQLLSYLFEHAPDFLGGQEAIRKAIDQAQSSPNPADRLSQKELESLANPHRKRMAFQSACLKIARHLEGEG
jgi:RNA polymerase sigma factor (sigma-70 family)